MNEDLSEELTKYLKKLQRPTPEQKPHVRVINSPFGVTVLGGIILAIVSMFTSCLAERRAIAVQDAAAKQAFLMEFPSKLERYMDLYLRVQKRGLWLAKNQRTLARETLKYPDGRNFLETRDKWESDSKYLFDDKVPSPKGLIYTAQLYFHSPAARGALEDLLSAAERYESSAEIPVLTTSHEELLKKIAAATKAMAIELRED